MIRAGDFVWTRFPIRKRPRNPELLHIDYCLATYAARSPRVTRHALVAYTTTVLPEKPYPIFVRVFTASEAARLAQAPFALHVSTLAALPIEPEWFPRRDIVARAPRELQA